MTIDHVAMIAEQSAALTEAVRKPGALERKVSACPGWTVADLVEHLGEVQVWWTFMVRAGTEPFDESAIEAAQQPVGDLIDWWEQRSAELVDVLRSTPLDAPAWCWWHDDRRGTVREIAFRQAHEALIHRWDAEDAVSTPKATDATVWADGVDEFATRMLIGDAWSGPSGVVALRADDVGQEWRFGCGSASTGDDGRPRWLRDRRARPLDSVLTGTAEQLDLLLWQRVQLDPGHVEGDGELLAAFLAWPDRN